MGRISLFEQLVSAEAAAAWAATFLLHSTMLIIAVWLLTRLLGMRAMTVQDRLWKVALVGALASCTIQAGLGERSRAPRITLPSVSAAVPERTGAAPPPAAAHTVERQPPDGTTPGPAVRAAVDAASVPQHSSWARAFLLFWCVGAMVFTGSLVLQLQRVRSRFSDRREIVSGPLYRMFRSLTVTRRRRRRPIRLTVSHRITVPVAYGIRRPEVCLPVTMLRGGSPGILKSILAHELAHIERRDQCWLLAARIIESIFFFQPLVRLARHCYQVTAEFICDGAAVRQTGERIPLARSLHEMACRQVSATTALTIPGISVKGAPLKRRIEMILDTNRSAAGPDRSRWFGPLVLGLILVFALLAPGVTAFDDPPGTPAVRDAERVPALEAVPAAPRAAATVASAVPAAITEPAAAPRAPEAVEPPQEPEVPESREPSPEEVAELEAEMAAVEQEMAAEAEAMRQLELEMAAEQEALIRADEEMDREAEFMRQMELELAEQEAVMARADRELRAEDAAMAKAEREMELMARELAAHEIELARAEQELAEQEEALARDLEALEEELADDEEAGEANRESREEVRAREREIRRRHAELRDRHREITREHVAISRHHREIARRQAEELRQRRTVLHTEQHAIEAQRRGLERALGGVEKSLGNEELTDEQRQRLQAIKEGLEIKQRLLEQRTAEERAVISDETVPRPEDLE